MTELFCIKHQEMFFKDEYTDYKHPQGDDICKFPLGYAFCAPPQGVFDDFVLYEDWANWCENFLPSPLELEASDAQAQEIMQDFEEE